MREELKPCPFCGSECVQFDDVGCYSYFREHVIYCEECDAIFTIDFANANKEDVAEAWNRRVNNG